MNRKYLIAIPIAILIVGLGIMPVQAAGTTTPLKVRHTYTGATLVMFDSDYNSKDFTIASGNQLDLDKVIEGFVLPDDEASVDLSGVSLITDTAIDSSSDFSPTMINSTFNIGVESSAVDSHVDAELSSAYADTRMDANVRFNTSGLETVTWTSVLATDVNGDGDYEDSADKHWRTSLGKSGQVIYWNIMADWNVSDADNYMKLTWSFKTTGANDYDVEIIHYTGTGDSAWSNIDSSGENLITLSLYDTDEEYIALGALMDELLQMDLGDNPVISGLNELIIEVGTDNANAEVDVRINNMAVFTDYPAITDATDNDDDFDLDGSTGGLMTGVHDDNDFLFTVITEGGTESYDSTVPLKDTIEESPYAMLQDAKIITFTGNFYVLPTEWEVSSSGKSAPYTTTEIYNFDSTSLDDLQTTANVFTWTDSYYNMTLSQAILTQDYEDFEDDLVSFDMEGSDKVEELRTLWDAADDDNYKVAYDGTNPDTTTGSNFEFELVYTSDNSLTSSGGISVAPAADNTMTFIVIGLMLIVGLLLAYAFVSSRKDRKKRKRRRKRN